ncbi:MAG TPA: hypothetical protein VK718_12490 [Ferruginibacter sp.]|jgi:hypothetical protein|nr:hypothetical protein [Ferruginibacter sp.]
MTIIIRKADIYHSRYTNYILKDNVGLAASKQEEGLSIVICGKDVGRGISNINRDELFKYYY